jgi:two-component system, OmpR family, sensor kinase
MRAGEAEAALRHREHLSIVAHELRSPVAALTALAAAAAEVPAAERPRVLALAIAAGRDIERVLTDAEPASLQREPVDLGALAVHLRAEAVVVSVAGRTTVEGDPTRLRQVLSNLVANGLRHGSRVAIDVGERDGQVVVDVADDGPGVDPTVDVFARGTSGAGSSGLGLWLARAIAEGHGGSLELVPASGRGACFRLSLPSASAGG